jgi:hypothetical protein
MTVSLRFLIADDNKDAAETLAALLSHERHAMGECRSRQRSSRYGQDKCRCRDARGSLDAGPVGRVLA